MPDCRFERTAEGVESPVANVAGGFVVPRFTSYDEAPLEVHEIATGTERPVAPFDGDGELGIVGGGGTVMNDHMGPAVDPPLFFATTCQ